MNMHPTTRALLEAVSRVLDVPPKRFDFAADKAADDAIATWNAAGRPDLKPLVGGPPPVPGIGWGVDPGSGDIETISRIRPEPEGRYILSWSTPAGRASIYLHSVAALYRPGDPADAPCWRRE